MIFLAGQFTTNQTNSRCPPSTVKGSKNFCVLHRETVVQLVQPQTTGDQRLLTSLLRRCVLVRKQKRMQWHEQQKP